MIKEVEKEWPLAMNHDEMEKEILSTIISQEFMKAQSEAITSYNEKGFSPEIILLRFLNISSRIF